MTVKKNSVANISIAVLVFSTICRGPGFDCHQTRAAAAFNDIETGSDISDDIKFQLEAPLKRVSRRDANICKSLIDNYETRKVDSCIPFGELSPFCDGNECPPKPSPPSKLYISKNFFDTSTKKAILNISWEKPLFGLNNLCGYQIYITSLSNAFYTKCKQFNSKGHNSYMEVDVHYGGRYNITVVSLPAFEKVDKSSIYKEVQIPDKCQAFKDAQQIVPWDCDLPTNLNVTNCINGTVHIKLDKIKSGEISEYNVLIIPGSTKGPSIHDKNYSKNEEYATIHRLPAGIKYIAMVFFGHKNEGFSQRIAKRTFTCTGKAPLVTVTNCNNGSVNVTWGRLDLPISGLQYSPKIKGISSNKHRNPVFVFSQGRSSVEISRLEKGISYIVTVDVTIGRDHVLLGSFDSSQFMCGLDPTTPGLVPLDDGHSSALSVVLALLCLLLVASLALFAWRSRWRIRLFLRRRNSNKKLLREGSSDSNNQSVMIVYPTGCKCLEQFAFLIGNVIKEDLRCNCWLDLVMEDEMQKTGGRNVFIMNHLEIVDYIIFIKFSDTDKESQHALQCHEQTIFNLIFSNKIDKTKVLPVVFEKQVVVGDLTPLCFMAENVKEQLGMMASKLLNVPTNEFAPVLPRINEVELDPKTVNAVGRSIASVRKRNHPCCSRTHCSRGSKNM